MRIFSASISLLIILLGGCQQPLIAQETAALTLGPEKAADRQQEMRRFDTSDDTLLLSASASVLQDLGFTIEEAAPGAGLLVASKDRDAVEGKQVAGQMFLALLVAAAGGHPDPVWEKQQKIRVSVITRRSADKRGIEARVLFQRIIWNTKNQVSRVETIRDHQIYQEFFERLSQATFLTAHEI